MSSNSNTAPKTWTHTDTASAGRPLTEEIARDHETLKQCYEQYKAAKTDEDRLKWVNMYIWQNARHAIAEELIVYPAMDKIMGQEGRDITEKDRDSHQRIKDDLYTLQNTSITDPEHSVKFSTVFESLWTHVIPEEKEDLPQFEKYLSHEQSLDLAKQFRKTQHFAPTRSHPSAPSHTPYETVAALLAAPLDKLGDLFRSFPDDETVREKLTTGAPKPKL